MFNHLVVSCARDKTCKPWFVVLSIVAESALLGIMILIPLIYAEALPKAMLRTLLVAPPPPVAPAPPAPKKAANAVRMEAIHSLPHRASGTGIRLIRGQRPKK